MTTSNATLEASEKLAQLEQVRAALKSDGYLLLRQEMERVRTKADTTLRNVTLPHAERDAAAGAVNAIDSLADFLPSLERSLTQTTRASSAARLGQK